MNALPRLRAIARRHDSRARIARAARFGVEALALLGAFYALWWAPAIIQTLGRFL